jgi:cytochrome c551/c552
MQGTVTEAGMKRAISHRMKVGISVAVAAFLTALFAAACAPNPSAAILSPEMRDQLAAELAGGDVVAATPTPVPLLVNLTPEQIYAGLPEDLAVAVANANIENGPTLATSNACIGCHALDPNQQMTGPTWHNVGDHAVARVPGQSPAEYLHQSIVAPGAFVVPDFPNVMPQTYGDTLSTQDLGDLIAYLLAQNGQP